MGKSRAAAYSLRGYAVDEDSHPENIVDSANASDLASSEVEQGEAEGWYSITLLVLAFTFDPTQCNLTLIYPSDIFVPMLMCSVSQMQLF